MHVSSSLLILLLALCCLLHVTVSSSSTSFSRSTTSCNAGDCGPMPMLMLLCDDGTSAGYTCQRNATTGSCRIVSPHCPTHSPDNTTTSNNDSTATHSPPPAHSGLHRNTPQYFNHSSATTATTDIADTTETAFTAAYATPEHPVFNCSRRQCGASIMPILKTCPDGSHAYPLCAWVSQRQRCGFLDPSCRFSGWRDWSLSVDVEELDVVAVSGTTNSSANSTAAQQAHCERGGCILPMYVKMCPGGHSVGPHCVWTSVDGTEMCLAKEPVCPETGAVATVSIQQEVDGLQLLNETNETNGAVMRGVSASLIGLSIASMLGLLVI